MIRYGPSQHPEVVRQFREGDLWEKIGPRNAELASAILTQKHCIIVSGEVADPPSLNYLRNVIGFVTFLLDHGGIAVFDPQMFEWWGAAAWRNEVFVPAAPVPRAHAVILVSPEGDGTQWLHTRGMRRPDLSIRHVAAAYREGAIDLCNRFIEFQAFGGVIPEGQEIRMGGLPAGLGCFHRGREEDPDFNNVHVAIELLPTDREES